MFVYSSTVNYLTSLRGLAMLLEPFLKCFILTPTQAVLCVLHRHKHSCGSYTDTSSHVGLAPTSIIVGLTLTQAVMWVLHRHKQSCYHKVRLLKCIWACCCNLECFAGEVQALRDSGEAEWGMHHRVETQSPQMLVRCGQATLEQQTARQTKIACRTGGGHSTIPP